PTGPSYWRPVPRARPSADRCRAPRNGRSRSDHASARSCPARTAGAPSSTRSQGLGRRQYLLRVAVHLHAAPLAPEHARSVEQERAALDAEHLATVHVLLADHVELPADGLPSIREQIERQAHLLAKLLVRTDAVAR